MVVKVVCVSGSLAQLMGWSSQKLQLKEKLIIEYVTYAGVVGCEQPKDPKSTCIMGL